MKNREINKDIRIKYLELPKTNGAMVINDNYKKIQTQIPKVFSEKHLLEQPLHSKVEESRIYEDINQCMSEKKMRCFRAQR